jgi:hypothetical protein
MDRLDTLTRQPFTVSLFANGQDITAASPIAQVQYHADGRGTRTLRDGRVVEGHWRFLNDTQTQVEVIGPEGSSRWVIVELKDSLYRKVNIDTGVEFIQRPVA